MRTEDQLKAMADFEKSSYYFNTLCDICLMIIRNVKDIDTQYDRHCVESYKVGEALPPYEILLCPGDRLVDVFLLEATLFKFIQDNETSLIADINKNLVKILPGYDAEAVFGDMIWPNSTSKDLVFVPGVKRPALFRLQLKIQREFLPS